MNSDVLRANASNFDSTVLQSPVPVLVDFWAPWCTPCKMIAPTVDELATEYKGRLRVVKVNTDENQPMLPRYGIQGIPALLVFSQGKEIDRIVGYASKDHLKKRLESALSRVASPA